MTPRKLLLLLLAVVVVPSCTSLEPPAATVNGIRIENADVATDTRLFTAIASITRQTCGVVEPGDTEQAACARSVLGTRIQEAVVVAYANAHGVTVTPAKLQQTEENLKSQLGGDKVADPQLRAAGISEAAFQSFARRVVVFQGVQSEIASGALNEAALHQLYEQNIAQFEDIHLEQILVKTQAEADRVYAEVTKPGSTEKDFMNLARKVSIDTTSASKGGDLGIQTAATFVKPLADAALALRPGEISQPVQAQSGWHVIRLISKDTKPYNVVRPTLVQQQTGNAFTDWLHAQLAKATVEVNPRYGRWDASAQQVVAIRSTETGTPTVAPSPTASPVVSP